MLDTTKVEQRPHISVYATREKVVHSRTNWHLYADYGNLYEAHDAVSRALNLDTYEHVQLRHNITFTLKETTDG